MLIFLLKGVYYVASVSVFFFGGWGSVFCFFYLNLDLSLTSILYNNLNPSTDVTMNRATIVIICDMEYRILCWAVLQLNICHSILWCSKTGHPVLDLNPDSDCLWEVIYLATDLLGLMLNYNYAPLLTYSLNLLQPQQSDSPGSQHNNSCSFNHS